MEVVINSSALSSPVLTLVDVNDKINRFRLDKFMEWFNSIAGNVFTDSFHKNEYYKVCVLADACLAGKPISAAVFRAAMSAKNSLEYALKPKSAPRGKISKDLISLPLRNDKNTSNIPVIEYQSVRILTTQQLAQGYGTEPKIISNNFNRNIERYKEGKHFYCLEGELKREFLNLHQIEDGSKNATKLYLWTERGALLHAKSLNTDKAWEVYDMLVETYFRVKTGAFTNPPASTPPQNSHRKSSDTKKLELEAKLNNSRARIARELAKIAARPEVVKERKQVLYSYATAALTGKSLLPLPAAKKRSNP